MNLRTNEWKSEVLFKRTKVDSKYWFYKILETIEERKMTNLITLHFPQSIFLKITNEILLVKYIESSLV